MGGVRGARLGERRLPGLRKLSITWGYKCFYGFETCFGSMVGMVGTAPVQHLSVLGPDSKTHLKSSVWCHVVKGRAVLKLTTGHGCLEDVGENGVLRETCDVILPIFRHTLQYLVYRVVYRVVYRARHRAEEV